MQDSKTLGLLHKKMVLVTVTNKTNTMKKGNLGISSIWDGPLGQEGRPHAKGNSRNNMEISKSSVPYESRPITECAKKRY